MEEKVDPAKKGRVEEEGAGEGVRGVEPVVEAGDCALYRPPGGRADQVVPNTVPAYGPASESAKGGWHAHAGIGDPAIRVGVGLI